MANTSRLFVVLIVLLSVHLTACKSTDNVVTADSGTSPGTGVSAPVIPPPVSAALPFGLTLFTTYDSTNFNNQLIFAQNGTSTSSCQVTPTNPTTTCTVTVPEGRLYFSKVTFAFSWLPASCKLLTFIPYSYQGSNTSNYFPPGTNPATDAATDCSQVPISTACFGGAAKYLVAGFPKAIGNIYLPDETDLTIPNKQVLFLPSGYSSNANSNRQSVNDMLASAATAAVPAMWDANPFAGDGYIANTYRNYSFSCRDDWYDPEIYTINLNIREQDSSGTPAEDDFYTWKEAPP